MQAGGEIIPLLDHLQCFVRLIWVTVKHWQEDTTGMLGNKVALITGAAHRIGASTAQLLHAEGMNLVLHYRSSREAAQKLQEKMLKKRPDSVILVQTDLRKIDNLPALIKEATDAWGRLDVLINNASTFYRNTATPSTISVLVIIRQIVDIITIGCSNRFLDFMKSCTPKVREKILYLNLRKSGL